LEIPRASCRKVATGFRQKTMRQQKATALEPIQESDAML